MKFIPKIQAIQNEIDQLDRFMSQVDEYHRYFLWPTGSHMIKETDDVMSLPVEIRKHEVTREQFDSHMANYRRKLHAPFN